MKFPVFPIVGFVTLTHLQAQNPEPPVQQMNEVTVWADRKPGLAGPFLPEVEGTKIFSGKKATEFALEELPQIQQGNYRQTLATTPGLILAEESTPLVSIGFRGFDPHRMQYFQVLQDGFPIHADMIGYPEAYYSPPLNGVEAMEFVRGGAALMYGPQPAGAINYLMRQPPLEGPFTLEQINMLGSFRQFSNWSWLGARFGPLGLAGYYNHRQSDGFREANSDYFVNAWGVSLAWNAESSHRWFVSLGAYDEAHGEPGGLTLANGPGTVNYERDRNATSRFFDRMRISRYAVNLRTEWDISDRTLLTFRGWWNYYLRFSRRQNGGGFGILPSGPKASTNQLETQAFYTFGIEPRLRHDWDWLGGNHTLSGGMLLYNTISPRVDALGLSPTAMTGPVQTQSLRSTWYYSLFAENKFTFGRLSITPGLRLENIWQSVREIENDSRTKAGQPLAKETLYNFAPLFGLGAEYAITSGIQAYANVSQSYRPPVFTQAVPTTPNLTVAGNLNESFTWNYEFGVRSTPFPWLAWDTSFFVVDTQDLIGTSTTAGGNITVIQNSGRAVVYGWDLMTSVDIIGLAEALAGFGKSNAPPFSGKAVAGDPPPPALSSLSDSLGSLNIFCALTLQDGTFLSGPNDGKTPQYLAPYLLRTGLIYNWRDRFKASFIGNFVGASFADDTNSAQRFIPAYDVWDLTLEFRVFRDSVSLFSGVNNIFNRLYYGRIRPDGIDPAMPQNWYAGVKVEF